MAGRCAANMGWSGMPGTPMQSNVERLAPVSGGASVSDFIQLLKPRVM